MGRCSNASDSHFVAAAVGFVADLELVLRDVMRGNPNGPCIEIEISLRSELLLVDKRQ